jgi:hypothetical protein
MGENSNPEKRLGDLERRHDKTREAFVDVLSMTAAGLAVSYLKIEGVITLIVDFVVAYAVMRRLTRWLLKD